MNILLIAGGWSSERPVSLSGAQVIEKFLLGLGHKVTRYDPEYCLDELPEAVRGQDFAFINLHGAPGEDGLIQAMLERLDCPYQGSGPAGSLLALDKTASKVIFKKHGIPTPEWRLLHSLPDKDWRPPWPCPVFVKSNTGGSSLGMARVDKPEDLHAALRGLFAQSGKYLIEPAVKGREVTCGVLADLTPGPDGKATETPKALPPILILPKLKGGEFFDYSSKYAQDGAEEICPAPLPKDIYARIQELALKAHNALGLAGYSRSDFILKDDGEPVILETNTLPGMTATSLVPREVAAMGHSFDWLLTRLIDLGLAAAANRKCLA